MDTCTDILATIVVYDFTGIRVGSSNVTNSIKNGTNYTFDMEQVESPNLNGSYYGVLYLTDLKSDAEQQMSTT